MYTRGRFERTHGDVLNGHTWNDYSSGKQVIFTLLEHLNRMLGSSLIANFLLTIICPHSGLSRASEVHQRNPWILPILRMGRGQRIPCTVQLDAQSLNAPLLPFAKNSSYEARRTKDKDHHDNDMSTTTHHTTPHPTTPTNNQQRAAHDMTRHHTTKKHKYTHAHAHAYVHAHVYLHVFVYVHVFVQVCVRTCRCSYFPRKTVWNTYLP